VSVHPSLDGSCAYSLDLTGIVDPHNTEPLTLRLADSRLIIHTTADFSSSTRSSFGGLWIDRTDFMSVLARKVQTGLLSRELASLVVDFVRDGFVILKNAVPEHVVDSVNSEIDAIWEENDSRVFIETFEPDGQLHYQPVDNEVRLGRTKLLDAYTVSNSLRDAMFAPAIASLLEAIFEAPPWAFQSLTFTKGSQQAIHKDTAYVKVCPPLHMAASWIALEDIREGAGELEYFPGSHHWPEFMFAGHRKWMLDSLHEHDQFLESLQRAAIEHESPRRRFSAKKGDVLIWHADLAQGDSPMTGPKLTRKSHVTHYCPRSAKPFYYEPDQSAKLEHGQSLLSSERGKFYHRNGTASKKAKSQ
jgi:hypothetical protein